MGQWAGGCFANGALDRIVRTCVDKQTGKLLPSEVLKQNYAKVLYDTTGLKITDGPESEDIP